MFYEFKFALGSWDFEEYETSVFTMNQFVQMALFDYYHHNMREEGIFKISSNISGGVLQLCFVVDNNILIYSYFI